MRGAPNVSWSCARCFRRAFSLSDLRMGLRLQSLIRGWCRPWPLLPFQTHDACAGTCISRYLCFLSELILNFQSPAIGPLFLRNCIVPHTRSCHAALLYHLPSSSPRRHQRLVRRRYCSPHAILLLSAFTVYHVESRAFICHITTTYSRISCFLRPTPV